MPETAPALTVADRVTDAELAQIESGLAVSNRQLGPYAPRPLAVLLRAADTALVGGLIGGTAWQWLSVKLLWVDPRHRRAGHGQCLLAAAEREAIRRGCHHARLNTFSFQAAGFYERCGYRRVLTLEDYPQGHQRVFYTKALRANGTRRMPRSLQTERLLLRPFRESDLEALARLYADARFMRYIGPPASHEESWRHLAMLLGHWELRGFGLWAAEFQGRLIGRVGLYQPDGWPDLELGWALDPDFWGRGLATEGARAALDQAARVLGRPDPVSIIRPDNAPSIRLAQRLGARYERTMNLRGSNVLIYRHRHPGIT